MLGAVAVSREERDKVTEFLYSKPASRAHILTAKLLSAFTQVALLNLANTLAAFGMLYAFHESAAGAVLTLAVGMLLVQLVFVTLGAAAVAATDNPKIATGIATGVILGAYLASVAVDMNGKIDWLKAFTPFSYFDARVVLAGGMGLNAGYVALSLALMAVFTAFAYWQFSRRDLHI
jgi:ABC-2 type transport system permease protein